MRSWESTVKGGVAGPGEAGGQGIHRAIPMHRDMLQELQGILATHAKASIASSVMAIVTSMTHGSIKTKSFIEL